MSTGGMHIKGHTSRRRRVARVLGRVLAAVPMISLIVLTGGAAAMADVQCAPQSLVLGPSQRSFDIVAVFPDSAGPTSVDVVTSSPGLYVVGEPNPTSNATAAGFAANWNSLVTMGLTAGAADGDYVITIRGIGADETSCTIDVEVDTAGADGPVVLLPDQGEAAVPEVDPGEGAVVVAEEPAQQADAPVDTEAASNPIDRLLSGMPDAGRFAVMVIAFIVVGGIVLSLGALVVSAVTSKDEPEGAAGPAVAPPLARSRATMDVDDLAGGATRQATPLPIDEPTPLFGPRKRVDQRGQGVRRSARQIAALPPSLPEHVSEPERRRPAPVPFVQRVRSSAIGRAYLMRKVRSRVRKPSIFKRIRTAVARERAAAQAPRWDPSTRPALPQAAAPDTATADTVEKTG